MSESPAPTIVIGIPGNWSDRSNILQSIVENSGGYMFAGMVLMHIESHWSCQLEIYDRDPHLREAFEAAGGAAFSESELDEIEGHTFTLYLSCDGGSPENAKQIMHAAKALLDVAAWP